MKFKSIFLLTGIVSTLLFANVNAAADVILEENFNDYSDIAKLPDGWEEDSLSDLTFNLSEWTHGKVLKLQLTASDESRVTRYQLSEPITEGVVKISYSFKPGQSVSTMFVIRDSEGNQLAPTYIHSTGELVSGWSSVTHSEFILRKKAAFDVWHHVEMYLDLDNQTYKAVITDDNGETYIRPWGKISGYRLTTPLIIKDFSGFRLQMWSAVDAVSYFDDFKIEKIPARCTVTTARVGGIYAAEDEQKINLTFENIADNPCKITYKWTAEEGISGKILGGNGTLTIDSGNEQNVAIDISALPFGTYMLNLEIETISGTNTYKESRSIPFSKILSSASSESSDFYGFATHMNYIGITDEAMELMELCGADGWRENVLSWQRAEPTVGTYETESVVQISQKTHNKGFESVYVLGYGHPELVKQVDSNGVAAEYDNVRAPTTTDEIEAFARYAAQIAKETKGLVNCYEVWNEWDGFANANKADATAYVRLLKATYNALKAENPDATVVGIGGLGTSAASERFLKEFCDAGGLYYCDAISFHPYEKQGYFPNSTWFDRLNDMLSIIDQYGERPPLYLTEMGWQTAHNTKDAWKNPPVSEKERAINMVKLAAFNEAHNIAEKIYIHDFMENGYTCDFSEVEHEYGVVTSPYHPYGPMVANPAYVSIAAVNKFMAGGVSAVSSIERNDYKTSAYCFRKKDGSNIAVLWNDVSGENIKLSLGCDNISVYDMYGNMINELQNSEGIYDFALENELIYITGDFSSFIDPRITVSDVYVQYNKTTQQIEVSGSAAYLSKVTIEVFKKGVAANRIVCLVSSDGTFENAFDVSESGEYDIIVGRVELEAVGMDTWSSNTVNALMKIDSKIDDEINIMIDEREVTIGGTIENARANEVISIMVIPQSVDKPTNSQDIIYLNETEISNGSFLHTFEMPEGTSGEYKLCLSSTNSYETQKESMTFRRLGVATFAIQDDTDTITAATMVKNAQDKKEDAVIFIAQYDGEGNIICVELKNISIDAGQTELIQKEFTVSKRDETKTASAFIWNDIDGIKPLFNKVCLE